MKNRDLKKQLAAAIAMTIVATVALGSSTYAWFVSNSEVTAARTTLTAETTSSLLISQNLEKPQWGTTILLDDDAVTLKPVSTVGELGEDNIMKFFEADLFATATENGNYAAQTFKDVTLSEKSDDSIVFMDTFYIKSSEACNLQLSTKTEFGKDSEGADIADFNLIDETLRLALVVTEKGGTNPQTFFYQVNEDRTGIAQDTTLNGNGVDGITQAIASAGESIDAPGTAWEISADNFKNGVPALKDHRVDTSKTSSGLITDVAIDTLFEFNGTEADYCEVTAYIWMEGCDFDCNLANKAGLISDANKIIGGLGFVATTL